MLSQRATLVVPQGLHFQIQIILALGFILSQLLPIVPSFILTSLCPLLSFPQAQRCVIYNHLKRYQGNLSNHEAQIPIFLGSYLNIILRSLAPRPQQYATNMVKNLKHTRRSVIQFTWGLHK